MHFDIILKTKANHKINIESILRGQILKAAAFYNFFRK